MRYLDRDGVRLAWDEMGSGPPILLIMGHLYSSQMWYPVFEDLADRYRLIFFDNRGSGESGWRMNTSIAELTADALAVLDAAGVDKAHVYGVSMGGGIALEFGIRYPDRVRSLILGCTMALTAGKPRAPAWPRELLYRIPRGGLSLLRSKKHKGGYGDAAPDDAIAIDKTHLDKDVTFQMGALAQSRAISAYSVDRADVEAIKAPTLVIHGTQDAAVPYKAGVELSEWIPGARLLTVQDCGHNYFVCARQEVNDTVAAFIDGVEAKA